MTMYKHFGSKDALAAAFLEDIYGQWSAWFTQRVSVLSKTARRPEDRALTIFDALKEWFETPEFRGCPFINTVAEISDVRHPARKAAIGFKQNLLELIHDTLRASGQDRGDLAEQMLMLVDGAIVRATMTASSAPATKARKAAAKLLL